MSDNSKIPLNLQPIVVSTCPDFIREREYLHQCVFPEMDTICQRRGISFSPVDLNKDCYDEMAEFEDIVRVSLDFCTTGAPFFICLLGERYGPHMLPPNRKPEMSHSSNFQGIRLSSRRTSRASRQHRRSTLLSGQSLFGGAGATNIHWLKNAKERAATSGYTWLRNEAYEHASLVELQILHAAFISEFEHCRFYFRAPGHVDNLFHELPERERTERLRAFEPESEYAKLKVAELKAKVIKRGLSVKYYRTLDELREALIEDLNESLNDMGAVTVDPCLDDPDSRCQDIFTSIRCNAFISSSISDLVCKGLSKFADLDTFQANLDPQSIQEVDPVKAFYREDYSKKLEKAYQKLRWQETLAANEAAGVTHASRYRVCTLAGSRGCGKSTLLAYWAKQFREAHPDLLVVEHYVDAGGQTTSLHVMLDRLTKKIRRHFGKRSHEEPPLVKDPKLHLHYQKEAFKGALSLGPVVLLIDGIDALSDFSGRTAEDIKNMSWLPATLPLYCRLVITTVNSDLTYAALCLRTDVQHLVMDSNMWSQGESAEFMENILDGFGQQMPDSFWEDFANWPLRSCMLAQVMLAQEYHSVGPGSGWNHYLGQLFESQTIRDLCAKITRRWMTDFSWVKLNIIEQAELARSKADSTLKSPCAEWDGWVADALRLLVLSRPGLRLTKLLRLLVGMGYAQQAAVSPVDWYRFFTNAFPVLCVNDGLITFKHSHFRQIMEHLLLGTIISGSVETRAKVTDRPTFLDVRCSLHCILGEMQAKNGDLSEAAYHFDRASNFSRLVQLITKPKVFTALISNLDGEHCGSLERLHEFSEMWSTAEEAGEDPLTMIKSEVEQTLGIVVEGLPCPQDYQTSNEEQGMKALEDKPHQDSLNIQVSIVLDSSPTILLDSGELLLEDDDRRHSKICQEVSEHDQDEKKDAEESKRLDDLWKKVRFVWKVGNFLTLLGYGEAGFSILQGIFNKLDNTLLLNPNDLRIRGQIAFELSEHGLLGQSPSDRIFWIEKSLHDVGTALTAGDCKDEEIYFDRDKALVLRGRCLLNLSELAAQAKDDNTELRYLKETKRVLKYSSSVTLEAAYLKRMAVVHHRIGAFDECFQCLKRSTDLNESWNGINHMILADLYIQTAMLLADKDWTSGYDDIRAEAYLRRAMNIQDICLPKNHLTLALTMATLAQILTLDNSRVCLAEAHKLLLAAFDIRVERLGVDHPFTQSTLSLISKLESRKPGRPGPINARRSSYSQQKSTRSITSASSVISDWSPPQPNNDVDEQPLPIEAQPIKTLSTRPVSVLKHNSEEPLLFSRGKRNNVRFVSKQVSVDNPHHQVSSSATNVHRRSKSASYGPLIAPRCHSVDSSPKLTSDCTAERFLYRTAHMYSRGGRPKSSTNQSLVHLLLGSTASLNSLEVRPRTAAAGRRSIDAQFRVAALYREEKGGRSYSSLHRVTSRSRFPYKEESSIHRNELQPVDPV